MRATGRCDARSVRNPVPAEEAVADEQRVAGALEGQRPGQFVHLEAQPLQLTPASARSSPCRSRVVEVAQRPRVRPRPTAAFAVNTMSGEPRHGSRELDLDAEVHVRAVQRVPLRGGQCMVHPHRHVHPRVDLVLDAEVIRPAHQHRAGHARGLGRSAVSPSGSGTISVGAKPDPAAAYRRRANRRPANTPRGSTSSRTAISDGRSSAPLAPRP